MRRQSWTTDDEVLIGNEKVAAINALSLIREAESLILIKSGRTRNTALRLDDNLGMYIDLKARDEEGKTAGYMAFDGPYNKQMKTWGTAQELFAAEKAKNYVKPMLPIKTGNLRNNAFKAFKGPDTRWDLTIDFSVAPYAQYPNVKRIIDANWAMIKQRFYDNMQATIGNRRKGLYGNSEDTIKVTDDAVAGLGGFRDKYGEVRRYYDAQLQKDTWGYQLY